MVENLPNKKRNWLETNAIIVQELQAIQGKVRATEKMLLYVIEDIGRLEERYGIIIIIIIITILFYIIILYYC